MPNIDVAAAVREGFRHGKQAPWLPALDWEHLLTRPLAEVRETIGYQRQEHYFAVVNKLMSLEAPGYGSSPLSPLPLAA
ncbi:MAG: hypothetical protein O2910_08200, partial [Proteobacteria bacterium]|nr:hypothetical protein [Pseudomonadota bacterium]